MPRSACWKKPVWSRSAPVNEPALWPKSWLSIRSAGMAAQIDRDHGPVGPRTGAVNGPGDQLLAGAAFAAHEHAARRTADAH